MTGRLDTDAALGRLAAIRPARLVGRVTAVTGLVLKASVPGIRVGELCRVTGSGDAPLLAEVVGFQDDQAILVPLGDTRGLGPDAPVTPTGSPLQIRCGDALRGRVLDAFGLPCDGGPPVDEPDLEPWDVERPAPPPMTRVPITRPLVTGIRAIDGCLTLGEGQRIGLFAGPGVGKSMLLGQLARASSADVNVICLVGERGREVSDFLDESLGPGGLARSIVVTATSDAPPMVRLTCARVATAIAEWFRDRRKSRVLLLMDSVTRVARAQREVGLAAGEPPARQGYPPSVFALLPRLLERAGATAAGSITAVYTVLVAGGDPDEPIADETRGVLDGHVVLDPRLAARGHFPAIDLLASLSRVMPRLVSPAHRDAARRARALLAVAEEHRDLVALGAYQPGRDARVDEALQRRPAIEAFLKQGAGESSSFERMLAGLSAAVGQKPS